MGLKIKILILVIAIIAIILSFFYYVLSDKKQVVSDIPPYSEIVNKDLSLLEDAILVDNSTLRFLEEYPKELRDIEPANSPIENTILVPKGSVLNFHKAMQITHAVSGSTYGYLFGEVVLEKSNARFPVIYIWGYLKTICLEDPCNYWEYDKAPWQKEKDLKKYFDK